MEMEKNREKLKFNSKELGMDNSSGIRAEQYEKILQSESITSFICAGNESKADVLKPTVLQQRNPLRFDEQGDIISRKILLKQEQKSPTNPGQIVVGSDSYLPGCSSHNEEFFDFPKKTVINFDDIECFRPVVKDNFLLGDDTHGKVLDFDPTAEENQAHTKNSRFISSSPDMQSRISEQNYHSSGARLLKLSSIAKNVLTEGSVQPQDIDEKWYCNEKYNTGEEITARARISLPEQLEVITPLYKSHDSDSNRKYVGYVATSKKGFEQTQTVDISVESENDFCIADEFDTQGDYAMVPRQSEDVISFDAGKDGKIQVVPDFFSENLYDSSQGFQSVKNGFMSDRKWNSIRSEVAITDINKPKFKKMEQMNCASLKYQCDLNRIPTLRELAQHVHLYANIYSAKIGKGDTLNKSNGTSGSVMSSVNYDENLWWEPVGKALEKNNEHMDDIAAESSERCLFEDNEKTIVWDPDESDLDNTIVLNCHEMKKNNRMSHRWDCYETSDKTERNHKDCFYVQEKSDYIMPPRSLEEMEVCRLSIEKESAAKSDFLGEKSYVGEASENGQVPVGGIDHQRSQSHVELCFGELQGLKSLKSTSKVKEHYEQSAQNIQFSKTPDEFPKYQSPFRSASALSSKSSTQTIDPSLESSYMSNSSWFGETSGLTVMDIIKHQLYFQAEGLSDWLKQFLPPEYYTSDDFSKYPFKFDKLLNEEAHVDQAKNKGMNQSTSDWSIEVSGQHNHEGCFEYKYHPWSLGTDEKKEKEDLVFSEGLMDRDGSPDLNLEKVTQVKYTRDYLLKLSSCILAYAFPEALRPFAKNMELPLKQLPYLEQPQSQPDVPFLPNVSYHNGMDHILFYQNVNYTSHLRRTENKSPN